MSSTEDRIEKVVIIGSGPAGWTAAIYAARANLDPLCIVGVPRQDPAPVLPGGQLMLTTEVENYPGFPEGVTGPEMMQMFQKQAERFGTRVLGADVDRCEFGERPFTLHLSNGDVVRTHSVIIATGATANWLGAAYLTKFASMVHIIHRRDEFRASKAMQDRVLSAPNVQVHWNRTVVDVTGGDFITGLVLKDTRTGETEELPVNGLFIAIGHSPATKFLEGSGVGFDDSGYVHLADGGSSRTNIDGVFAAGDVADQVYRQAITAAGMGCRAAIDAERWLAEHGVE